MAQTRPREIFGLLRRDEKGEEETAGRIHGRPRAATREELAVIKRKRIKRAKDRGKSNETVGSSVFVAREAASRVKKMTRRRRRRKRLIQEETEAHERLTTGESGKESPEASRTTPKTYKRPTVAYSW